MAGGYLRVNNREEYVVRAPCCIAFLVIIVVGGLVTLFTSVRIVQPAHACVVKTFGHISDSVLEPGIHVITPLSTLCCFSLRKQLLETDNSVPTQEGLAVDLDVAIIFALDPAKVKTMYVEVGEDYVNTVVAPELASAVRDLTAQQEAKALYTSGRQDIQDRLFDVLNKKFDPYGVKLRDVLLKSVKLPAMLTSAIEAKARVEQEAEQMSAVLDKEKSEAERKRIEAQGIADFQAIVSQGISAQLLQWKGIEATEKFAQSPNAKVVLVGNSGASLPVLLSTGSIGDFDDPPTTHQTG
ncbi:hypothetical protein CTAYLR_010637 [Chrysophaeum taylorii]|uniref:Prohibitin n=1 Tax=Chrysophaeum taylorii TaxID=2483200 RepID=A0AAD7XRI0_9STRA|nr:hypothetical protein CTAYLR_010637 [Chrysophaeum taylorii]